MTGSPWDQQPGGAPYLGAEQPGGWYPPLPAQGLAPSVPRKAPSAKFWWIGGGVVAVVAVIVIVLVAAAGGSGETNTADPWVSDKPDITMLTEDMFLSAGEFPDADGAKYGRGDVEPFDNSEGYSFMSDSCFPENKGSWAEAEVMKEGAETGAVMLAVSNTSFGRVCIADKGKRRGYEVDIFGLPSSVVTWFDDGMIRAMGSVRGVLVSATVWNEGSAMSEGAKADLVVIYKRQAEKLNTF